MSVKPEHLDNPERDLDVTTRDPRGADRVRDAIQHVKKGTPMPISDEVKARIEVARKLVPTDKELHCRDCFEKGRDAAIRAIEGEGG